MRFNKKCSFCLSIRRNLNAHTAHGNFSLYLVTLQFKQKMFTLCAHYLQPQIKNKKWKNQTVKNLSDNLVIHCHYLLLRYLINVVCVYNTTTLIFNVHIINMNSYLPTY